MGNQFNVYDPLQYANIGIMELHKALGMANRVYRGYDKAPTALGSTIAIPIPSTFVAQDAPGNDQDINADSINIKLTRWKEVKFALSDQELNYTQDQIINKHIMPAAYAIADAIDKDLCGLATRIPWKNGTAGTTPSQVPDITGVRRLLFNNKVPLSPSSNIHLMVDGNAEEKFLQLQAFSQNQGAGLAGVDTQMTGTIGTRFGMEIFANQNVVTQIPGNLTQQVGLAVNGSQPILGTSVNLDGTTVAGTIKVGDVLSFAGDPQKYAVVETPDTYNPSQTYTASGNALNGVFIAPHLKQALADNTAATVTQTGGVQNLAFHTNAFALATAPLTDMASQLGAKVSTVTDPISGLSLRSRVWYTGNTSQVHVGLDILYGYRVLDANKAAVMLG